MYQKILITTDGSSISCNTAREGVRFAQQLGARVLVLYVAPAYQVPVYVEIVPPSYPSEDDYLASMRRNGERFLQPVLHAAQESGLQYEGMTAFSDATAQTIVDVAAEHGCDLIFMGSHGRSGWGQLLLGSVTNKVLSHTLKPVLVHRLVREPGGPT